MSSYPDTISAIGAPGPSLSTLRVQYLEEHGVMPGPELDRELLDKYWEANPPRQEGSFQHSAYNPDQAQQQQQQQQQQQHQHQHEEAGTSGDGHLKLVQRRLDLAPFLGSPSIDTYSNPHHMYQPGAFTGYVSGYVSASPALPVTPSPLAEHSFDLTADVVKYGDPFLGAATSFQDNGVPFVDGAAPFLGYGFSFGHGAAPVLDYGGAFTNHAAPIPSYDDPFVTKASTDSAQAAPAPRRKTAAVLPRARRPHKVKDPWTKAEIDRVVFLREKQNKNWEAIHKDLGTHTPKSIGDKYWQVVRLAKGLKK